MIDITTFILFIVVFVLVYLYRKGVPPSSLPPGPKGWPFIGFLDMIYYGKENKFHVKTAEWGRQYGGLFNLQIGQCPTIMVTDLDILKEVLLDQADVWSDRPLNNDFIHMIGKYGAGVALSNGEKCKQLRRMTIHSMRDFGVGKQSIEEKINEEILEVCKEIDSHGEKAFNFDFIFNRATTNVICNVLFSNRYSYDDPTYKQAVHSLNQIFKHSGFQNIFIFLPWYTFWLMPVIQPKVRGLFKDNTRLHEFIGQVIKEHRRSFDPSQIRDFVDLYLEAEQSQAGDIFTESSMRGTIMDLFLAGSETTSTTLLWTILFLIKHPEVQDKCRQEILQKIGNSRIPTYKDRGDLPYVEATLSEVQRLGSIAPVVFLHNTSKTATLRGYTIPKDTLLTFNLYAIHNDPKRWQDPKKFQPERFLDETGACKRPEAFVAFGLGKRACLGEMLARMEHFLFVTALLQRYEFRAEDPTKLPSVEDTSLGITLIPEPFSVKATKL